MFEKQDKIVYEKFRGLFNRGREEACPNDYMLQSDNMIFQYNSMKIRRGQIQLGYNTVAGSNGGFALPVEDSIVDIFKVSAEGRENVFLVSTAGGRLLYTGSSFTTSILPSVPVIPTWNGEFNAVQIGKRIYIMLLNGATPMYVWEIGKPFARTAGGKPPVAAAQLTLNAIALNPAAPFNDTVGIEAGFRIVAILYETDTGFITNFENHTGVNVPGNDVFDGTKAARITNITLGGPDIVKRYLISTKILLNWDGNIRSPEYFFVADPSKSIENNTATEIPYISWLDSELVDSADDYIDQLAEIPNARRLTLYNGRLVVVSPVADRNACYISKIGEPESFDAVNSILKSDPQTYRGIEDVAEHRGNMYIFRDNSTQVTQDDDTNPNEWKVITVDKSRGILVGTSPLRPSTAIGQYNHQPVAVDGQLLCFSNGGLHTFDGSFRDEITWSIRGIVEHFASPTIIINPTTKLIAIGYGNLTDTIYVGDYGEGLTPDSIKWGVIILSSFDSIWKNIGLYSIYGDGSNIIACSRQRIFGWNKDNPNLDDLAKGEAGQDLHIAFVPMKFRFSYAYPNDGWVYQWNEIVSRIETVNASVGAINIRVLSLDDFRIVDAGSIPVTSQRGQIQRKWFNFKSEACSIEMSHVPISVAIGADFKNVSLSYQKLWAKRPRSSTSAI